MATRKWPVKLKGLIKQILLSDAARKLVARFEAIYSTLQVISIKKRLKKCGDPVHLQLPVCFTHLDMIELGDDVSLAGFIHIWGGGGVKVGNRVMIGSHTAITSVTHDYSAETMYGSVVVNSVIIKDDVWIGSHAVILPGVTIGEGAVVGAGCIVTRDVPPRAIVTGVPGQVVRFRPSSVPLDEQKKEDCDTTSSTELNSSLIFR